MYNPNLDKIKIGDYIKYTREVERWNNLTPEQQKAEYEKARDKSSDKYWTQREEQKKRRNEEFARQAYISNRNPHALTKDEAVVIWVAAMIVGTIFNERLFIWIFASILLFLYFTFEKRREIKWDNGGKEEYYKKLQKAHKERK